MRDQNEYIEVVPDPERISEGLRDTGYQFHTAVADIIDNSISAGASEIEVKVDMDMHGEIFLAVLDDGCGMDREELINAMRYGSKRRTDPSSLGKFGLGLKTASTAFCKRLSVITRNDPAVAPLKATWDLDLIAETKKWELELGEPSQNELQLLERAAPNKSGTVVLWEKIDRLVREYSKPGGKPARKALERHVDVLKEHCSMVYQRFLDHTDMRARNVTLRINGQVLDPWDPFCLSETKKPLLEEKQKVTFGNMQEATFIARAFVLPRKDEFSDAEAARRARLSNDYQGIYVYRENRMIHGPDWMDMFRKEPHFTLLRVEFSFDHKLDEAFHIDIKKSQILLNEDLFEWLQKFLIAPRREAEQRYRSGRFAAASGVSVLLHTASNNAIHAKAGALKTANLKSVDGKTGEVTIENKYGPVTLKLKLSESTRPEELHVQPVEELVEGILWEPALIDGNQAVRINTRHPYYSKVYLPNRKSGVTVQGLDSLLWALCAAELGTVNEETKRYFEELRYEVSRLLRRLVEDLPDPDLMENENE